MQNDLVFGKMTMVFILNCCDERGTSMTILEIAKEAGVSPSSVSRVINGKPGVNMQTRAKIMDLLKEHHYTLDREPHPYTQENSHLVGILVADVRNVHLTEGAYHISRALSERGYSSLIENTGNSDEGRATAIKRLKKRNVAAVVLLGSIFQSDIIKSAIEEYLHTIPVFMLNGFLDLPNVCSVLSDEKTGVYDCVKLLAGKGRRKIAFLLDDPRPSSSLKEAGFVEGMNSLGWKQDNLWIRRNVDASFSGGFSATEKLIEDYPDLEGIICSMDIIACGAVQALVRHGISIPDQVAVVGVDNSIYAEICMPQLTSLNNMILDSSVTIAHKLTDWLEGRKSNQRTMLFTSIVEREST